MANNDFVAACRDGEIELVKAMLAAGVDPNVTNVAEATGLELACSSEERAIVSYLLEQGASPNRKEGTPKHTTALIHAATKGNEVIVRILCEAGADLNAVDDGYQQTALMWACAYGRSEEVVRVLLEKGADPNLKDEFGNTALTLSEYFGFESISHLVRGAM